MGARFLSGMTIGCEIQPLGRAIVLEESPETLKKFMT